jgi:hypothetical protein
MTQLTCPSCKEVIVNTVNDVEEALVPIVMHHAVTEEREKTARLLDEYNRSGYKAMGGTDDVNTLALAEIIKQVLEHAIEMVRMEK